MSIALSFADLQQPLITLTKTAGFAVLDLYQQNLAIQLKADQSPVTEADFTAHRILCKGLQALTPEIPILSEEGTSPPWEERQSWSTYWLLDPLDGTRQFIQHTDQFTINVSLIQDSKPVIGLLYVPVTNELYYASEYWGGAYKSDTTGTIMPLRTCIWQKDKTKILLSRRVKSDQLSQLLKDIGQYELIQLSSAWKFGRLAEGEADISLCLGDTCEWDTAAGQCIVELAGGCVLDLNGYPLRYNTRDSLINPHFIVLGDRSTLYPRLFSI